MVCPIVSKGEKYKISIWHRPYKYGPLFSDGFVEETARDSAGETTSSLSSSADFPSSSALVASEAAFEPLREDLFDLSETFDPALEPAFDFLDLQRRKIFGLIRFGVTG